MQGVNQSQKHVQELAKEGFKQSPKHFQELAQELAKEGQNQSQKRVQELANEGVEVPDLYITKDPNLKKGLDIKESLPVVELPVIDFSRLTSNEEFEKLREAFNSWGCFEIINHGMESIMDEMRRDARQFFDLPMEEKRKYARPADGMEGYGSDPVVSEGQCMDWSDRVHLTVSPEDGRKMQFWPEKPESFRKTLHEFTVRASAMVQILLRFIAKALGLPENSILSKCGDKTAADCRFNYYPPCPRPELVLGLKQHSDGSLITIVLPDEDVEGLQLHKDNQWYRVRPVPRALEVNFGDQLQILSNGIFKSPLHRAVPNQEKARMSVVFLATPENGKAIGPLEELIDEKRPRLYKTVKNYIEFIHEAYQNGISGLEVMRI